MTSPDITQTPLIVPLGSRDVDDIARIHVACFDEAWNARILTRILAMTGAFALGVRQGGGVRLGRRPPQGGVAEALAGFAIARVAADECELLSLGVAPASRGLGLGAMMLDAALVRAGSVNVRKFFLEVAENNIPALTLYKARGLTQIGRRPKYYENKDGSFTDAITMRVELPEVNSS
ncbi:MAG: GNAT family N-acetyltransferase [Rhodospirillales bacterium]|nr:GNAT family N-acetyltransferase [Rhodospirillales bacterium]